MKVTTPFKHSDFIPKLISSKAAFVLLVWVTTVREILAQSLYELFGHIFLYIVILLHAQIFLWLDNKSIIET